MRAALAWILALAAGAAVASEPLTEADRARLRKLEFHTHVAYEHYSLPGDDPIGLIGFKFDQFVTRRLFWGPAIYGAVLGRRGGYGIAALGAGYQVPLASRLRGEARILAGSGGGSGVPTGGGFLLHGTGGLQADLFPRARLAAHAGYIAFPSGRYHAPVFSLAMVFTGSKVILPD